MAVPTVEQIRAVGRYRVNYLWNVQFPTSPFSDWFPATSVDEDVVEVESYSFNGFLHKHSIPSSGFSEPRKVSITFLDAEDMRLFNWLTNWMKNTILNGGRGVSPLADCVKPVLISRLANQNEVGKSSWKELSTATYYVYPVGKISFEGKSTEGKSTELSLVSYKLDFVVVHVLE